MKTLKVGDKVTVKVPEDDECFAILEKYNGREMVISRKSLRGSQSYYELEGAVSDRGIPYAFIGPNLKAGEDGR